MTTWHSVWASRKDQAEGSALSRALQLDGFDVGAGQVAETEWINFVGAIVNEVRYGPRDSVLDLGCGAGAFLLGLEEVNAGMQQTGVDYSKGLLSCAEQFLPSASFICADLRKPLPELPTVNHVLVHSVLQYLSVNESLSLIEQCFPVALDTIALLDIPDSALYVSSEDMRRMARPEGEYESSYHGLRHTYYDRELIESLAPAGWKVQWIDKKLRGYANAPYRFSLFYRKDA